MDYKFKKVDGYKIAYHEDGEGYPLICVPAWTGSSFQYSKIPGLLENSGIKVIRFDIPGWGGFSDQITGNRDFNRYRDLISDIINSFGYKDYALLGYSLGVTFILHGIATGQIKPSKVVLVSGLHSRRNLLERESLLKRNCGKLKKVMSIGVPYFIVKTIMRIGYYFEILTKKVYRSQAKYFFRIISDSMRSDFHAVVDPIYTAPDVYKKDFKNFKGKSMVVYNEREPWYFREFNEEISEFLNVKPTIIKDVGNSGHRHLAFEPEVSIDKIKEFVLSK